MQFKAVYSTARFCITVFLYRFAKSLIGEIDIVSLLGMGNVTLATRVLLNRDVHSVMDFMRVNF